MGSQISLCKFHENSLIERLHEGKTVSLWGEYTDHNEVSPKACFSFVLEDLSFGPVVLQGIRNISSQIPKKWGQPSAPRNPGVIQWFEITLHKPVSQKAPILTEPRLFVVSGHHRVSSCRFCQSTVSKLLNENKDLTLWAEFSHKEEVSEKAAPQICLTVVRYSPWDSSISKISLLSFHKVSASRLLHERVE